MDRFYGPKELFYLADTWSHSRNRLSREIFQLFYSFYNARKQ